MLIHFYKRQFDEMVIEIVAEEYTSSVSANNFQDYYGNTSTLTFRRMATGTTLSVGLYSIAPNTFEGVVPLADLPFGLYQLQGRIEDVVGNAAIISDYYDPQDLPVQPVEIVIEVGYNLVPVLSFTGLFDNDMEIEGKYNLNVIIEGKYSNQVTLTGNYRQEINIPCQ